MHLDEALVERIRAVDARLRVHAVERSTATWLRKRASWNDDPSQDTPREGAARQDFQTAISQAEVWFSPDYRGMQLPSAGPLSWAQFWSAGLDRLLAQDPPPGVAITSAAGLHAVTIAEWILAYMLSHAKRLPRAFQQQQAACWTRWAPGVLRGRTVGIVGLGAIGRETARVCDALGMRVLATKRSARDGDTAPHCDRLYSSDRLLDLLAASDYVVLACPLTAETRGLIGPAEFNAMKAGAALVNIARGEVVQWTALLDALRQETISACYTDVTVPEPLPDGDPIWAHPNLVITPHVTGNLDNYHEGATAIFIDNLRRYIAGEPLFNLVDIERGY